MSCKLTQIENGVEGIFVKNERFSTTLISFHFYLPLKKETAAGYSLLPFLMTTCSEKYPDFSKLNYKLSKLYGASLEASAEKVGDLQSLKIAVSVIDDKYALDGEALCEQACELLLRLIFAPKVENGEFAKEDVEREKRKAIEHIRGEFAEKRVYARKRLIEEMYGDDDFATPKCGTEEQVAELDGKALYEMWKTLLSKAFVRVNVISSNLPNGLFEKIGEHFAAFDRTDITDRFAHRPTAPRSEVKEVTERMDLSQGKLSIGFSCDTSGDDYATGALAVMCDILGGGPYSKLFSNVREKMSLCYYCSSSAIRIKGLLTVDSGVESQNAETAKNAILDQLNAIKNGEISDFEFSSSKKSLTDGLCTVNDSQAGIDAWYATRISNRNLMSPEDFAKTIENVTRENIIATANGIKLHTVYRLLPKEVKA
ncbi:MAG: insulinase family protein [Ruminococcaceae bacterium]|nr:insulinase family protein [Oscillospiraceae bacterium]